MMSNKDMSHLDRQVRWPWRLLLHSSIKAIMVIVVMMVM